MTGWPTSTDISAASAPSSPIVSAVDDCAVVSLPASCTAVNRQLDHIKVLIQSKIVASTFQIEELAGLHEQSATRVQQLDLACIQRIQPIKTQLN